MPPEIPFIGFGRGWGFTLLTPSTTIRLVSSTLSTVPRLPLSLPVVMMTSSPLRILFIAFSLQHFWSKRNNLHEAFAAQFTRHRPEDTSAYRLHFIVKQHCSIAIELDQRTIRTTNAFSGAYHDSAVNVTLIDTATRRSIFDADLDNVANACITALGATQHLDAHNFTRTAIVGNLQTGLHLNHEISPT